MININEKFGFNVQEHCSLCLDPLTANEKTGIDSDGKKFIKSIEPIIERKTITDIGRSGSTEEKVVGFIIHYMMKTSGHMHNFHERCFQERRPIFGDRHICLFCEGAYLLEKEIYQAEIPQEEIRVSSDPLTLDQIKKINECFFRVIMENEDVNRAGAFKRFALEDLSREDFLENFSFKLAQLFRNIYLFQNAGKNEKIIRLLKEQMQALKEMDIGEDVSLEERIGEFKKVNQLLLKYRIPLQFSLENDCNVTDKIYEEQREVEREEEGE